MKRAIQAVAFTLLGAVLVVNVIQFVMIFADFGWRGIPVFLSYGVFAWIAFIKGIAAILSLTLIIIDWFLEEKTDVSG